MYRMGAGGALALIIGLGLNVDAIAQQSSGGWRNRLNNIWNRIARDDDDQDPPWGSRGPICAIAPTVVGVDTPAIWHDQPVIVWQVMFDPANNTPKFVVRNAQTQEIMWEYASSVGETSVVYDGEPLQPGHTYELEIFQNATAEERLIFPDFQVLPQSVRTLITNGLQNSVEKNEFAVDDAEWTAVQQAEYFADRNLPYDAVQSLFSVSEPSSELQATQAQILEEACSTP